MWGVKTTVETVGSEDDSGDLAAGAMEATVET